MKITGEPPNTVYLVSDEAKSKVAQTLPTWIDDCRFTIVDF